MSKFVRTPLRIKHRRIFYNRELLKKTIKEIVEFLDTEDYMHTVSFAREMMGCLEIKSNNEIEGINDDLSKIESIIAGGNNTPYHQKQRIINLHRGYEYILQNDLINRETLKELYELLSDGLLNEYSLTHMGKYYRQGPVFIAGRGVLEINQQGMPEDKLDYYMNVLLNYINEGNEDSEIDNFIKSQIIHFFFVYVHPYFDVNGRTSRTTALWHLIKSESYPYIVFNRAIALNKSYYQHFMKKVTNHRVVDLTRFLKYMLIETLTELERESILRKIETNEQVTNEERQMLEYILVSKDSGLKSLTRTHNLHNNYKSEKEIEEILEPLTERRIIIPSEEGIQISSDILDTDTSKLKRLSPSKFTR